MDSSGKIDSYEFICALALISHANLKEKAAAIFRLYDFDNSLVLNFDEMVVLVRCCLCSLAALCGRQDIPSIQEVEELVTELLKGHDKDYDGQISLDEFQGIVTKDRRILKTLQGYGLLKSYDLRENFGESGEGDNEFYIPECDSDLELEENKGYDFDSDDEIELDSNSDQIDRIRQGIDFKIKTIGDEMFQYEEDKIKGDNSIPNNFSWKKDSKAGKPSDYISGNDPKVGTIPEVDLELEYIYGYRCHDTRNNIAYSPSGDLIYHTAAVGIVMNKKNQSQKFFFGHYDDITCLDVYDTLVATGQVGKIPSIHIWDSSTCKSRGVITSPLQRGISHLCFSNNGKKLAAISIDKYHSVAVFDVQKLLNSTGNKYNSEILLAFARGPEETVFHMVFDCTDNRIVFGCKRGIYFGNIKEGKITLTEGDKWTSTTPKQAILCLTSIDNQNIIAGSTSGKVLKWKGTSLTDALEGHSSSCTAICKRNNNKGVITGGNNGKIIYWDGQMNKITIIDLYSELSLDKKIKLNSIKIRAISEDKNMDITIGTRGGELLEKTKDGRYNILMRGHFNKELWGICNLKNGQEFATVGEDFLLNIYDIAEKSVISSTKLMFQGNCIDSSPDSKRLAVGCKNGYVLIIDISTKQTIKTLKDREKAITCIKFSSEGKWLSVGGEDSEILNYNVKENYSLKSRFRAHHSSILHFDFSKDGLIIQSVDQKNEIFYSKVEDGKRVKSGMTTYKDEEWSTWTLPIGWHVQGIWPQCSNGKDINAVARSTDQNLLATVDDYGLLKLFRFPSPVDFASYTKYIGHSSHVTNVIFSEQGSHILTTGGHDKSVMQWKLTIDNEQTNEGLMIEKGDEEEDIDEKEFSDMIKAHDKKSENQGGMFKHASPESGEQEFVSKPYLAEVKATIPSEFEPSPNHNMAPNQNLELHHVYGFRSVGAKDSVKYSSNDKIVFISASLGVTMESKNCYQTFFSGHNDDVVSLAIHPKKHIAATGQVAFSGESKMIPIHVWDIETKEILATLKGFHRGCVRVLKFSPDGSKLLSIGTDKDHSIAIYDWARERLISQSKIDKKPVTDAAFQTDNEFVTVGAGHIKFWKQTETKLSFKRGRWGLNSRDPIICAIFCFPQNICFTGGKSGRIHTWRGETCSGEKQAHNGVVRVLVKHKHILYSGGDDGIIIMWSYSGKLQSQGDSLVNMNNISTFKQGIRSIDIKKDNTILVGTRGSDIYEIGIDGEQSAKLLLSGHFSRRIMGLAVHPKTAKFVTTGEDKTIRIWDGKSKNMTTFREFDEVATAIDWSSDGQFLAVATKSGQIILLGIDLQEFHRLHSTFTSKNNEICVIKISPDCTKVAFGSHGSTYIEIHNISNNKLVSNGLIKGMTSVVNFIDWSVESNLIMANSLAYELKFFSITTMKQIKSSSVKDQQWYTWTCAIGWSTQGILSGSDRSEINTVCRAQNQNVLAIGEDSSLVKIFRYPSIGKKSGFKAYKGHSSHVTQIRFIGNDEFLVSTGSLDRTIILWKTDFGNFEGLEEDQDYETIEMDLDPNDIANTDPNQEEIKETEDIVENKGEDLNKEENHYGNKNSDENQLDLFGQMIKPWQMTCKPPRKFLKPPVDYDKKPRISLSLYHTFGFHSKNVRNSAKLTKGDSVIYFSGALAINHNIKANKQSYFDAHKNKITVITINEEKKLVASGEIGMRPIVYIWDAETLIILQTLRKGLKVGIKSLEFSQDSSKLLTICSDKFNTLVIYNVENGALFSKVKTGTQRLMDSVWVNQNTFVTVGINHLKVWTLKQGRLKDKLGLFNDKCKILTCCALNSNQVLVGNVKGEMQVWKGNKLEKDFPIHDSCIDTIKVTDN